MDSYDIDEIHSAAPAPLDLVERLGLHVARGSKTNRAIVLCPWHNEKNPSCVVTERDGRVVAYCHSCRAGGDLLSLVAAVHGTDVRSDFARVLELAAEVVGVAPLNKPNRKPVTDESDYWIQLAEHIERGADDWLAGRDIRPDELVENAAIGDIYIALDLLHEARDVEFRLQAARDDALDRMEVPEWSKRAR